MLDKNFYIKNGLIYGSINVIYLLITYVMGIDTMTSYANMGISMLIGLSLMVYFGTQVRKAHGGYMTVGEGFKSLMVIYAIATFLYLVVNHLLGTVIDPELPAKMADASIEKAMGIMEMVGAEDEVMDQMYDEMETKVREETYAIYSVVGFIKLFFQTLAMGAVGSVIIAAILKKANPNPFAEDLHE